MHLREAEGSTEQIPVKHWVEVLADCLEAK